MDGSYKVHFGKRTVGNVTVQRQGLYYRFSCVCELSGDVLCRLQVTCGSTHLDLGILVPVGKGFGLDTRVPAKQLSYGKPEFTLVPKQTAVSELFVPVYPEEPFAYISRLKKGYLARKDGKLGIVLE